MGSAQRSQRGYSILEAIIVLGLIAMIAAATMPLLYRLMQAYKVRTAASTMATQLRYLRGVAVSQKQIYQVVVNDSGQINPNAYMVLYDPDRDGSPTTPFTTIDTTLPEGLEIVAPSVDTITFNMRGGAVLSPTTESINFKSPDGTQYRIAISLAGAVTVTKQ